MKLQKIPNPVKDQPGRENLTYGFIVLIAKIFF
jgi:hypothetical protein